MDWLHWLKGLVAAIIGGISTSVVAMFVAPDQFNLSNLRKLAELALGAGIINAAMYLKQSPVPPEIETKIEVTETNETTKTS